eukprot:CAMPEP_0204307844 /NCGR_PEP_ID=MMETSP0469-20131031/158_1 /ASSEMBLY_ACC=CAM_ASM_000384 /TAXON_ID=2969 /ORGANISM="Oxyrrhis marina" /LENGTH=107 /DNA_ID=CAMNT_0051287239 /DNA_START=366 /DNA_END=686 /DNA_ORIENTATION=-
MAQDRTPRLGRARVAASHRRGVVTCRWYCLPSTWRMILWHDHCDAAVGAQTDARAEIAIDATSWWHCLLAPRLIAPPIAGAVCDLFDCVFGVTVLSSVFVWNARLVE